MALSDDDIRMIARLTVDAEETPARFRRQGMIAFIGALLVAALAAARAIWFLVPVCVLFGAGLLWLFRVAARKSGADRYGPVLAALREAPERVLTVAHLETSDSHRIFISHWVVVTTADGSLRVRAPDWQSLLAALARRCPGASIKSR